MYTPEQRALARDLLMHYRDDPKRWTQCAHVRDGNGDAVTVRHKSAACWCLVGATYAVRHNWLEPIKVLSAALSEYTGDVLGVYTIVAWNDHPDRTFADVTEFLRTVSGRAPTD